MDDIILLKTQIAAKPTLLQTLRIRSKPKDPIPVINELLKNIAEKYFSPFVAVYAGETSASTADVDALKQELLDLLIQNVGMQAGIPNEPQFALALKIDRRLEGKTVEQYVSGAKIIFDVRNGKPAEFNPAVMNDTEAIEVIALAIQETVADIPLRFYEGPETVTEKAEESLYKILTDINEIRKARRWKDVPGLGSSTSQLYRSIAIADDYVWLPLKPLITAPLAGLELPLYARDNADSKHLANQIVRSDGVILITGYRGVGKSTFINQVLYNIETAQGLQVEDVQCQVVAVPISVAKVAGVGGALRLCIRALYRTFRNLEEWEDKNLPEKIRLPFQKKQTHLLSAQEKQHLWFANLRASYKVSMSQADALSQSRSLQGGLGLNPGDFFLGPVKTAVMAVVPTIGYKTSKDWNEKMDRTISLLDYDEDRAEEDLGQFIDMLAEPRPYNDRMVRVKLLFIFDEMDKMEAREGQDVLIRSLKNLFLRRHAVFLLVTSKEFYYMLLEDRKKEDSILGSYFSAVITVPMFSSANTQLLLENLLADTSGLSLQEQALISNLAKYFTYRARGLPREVMREIRSLQRWAPRLLQSYLTDRSVLPGVIQLYALIQDALENLNSQAETDSSEKENLLLRERIWLSEGRQEQIRRGLYILMEELLNAGSFTVDSNTKFASYDSNFSTVAYADFCNIFDQLAGKLALIRLPDDLTTGFFERVASEITASAEPVAPQTGTGTRSKTGRKTSASTRQDVLKPTASKQVAIRVLPAFYSLTGRQIGQRERVDLDDEAMAIQPEDVMQHVDELLDQEGVFQTRRALSHLSQNPNLPIPDDVQDKLFHLFLTSEDLAFRIEAGKYLSCDGFYRNVNERYPHDFLEKESNEPILKQFVDLTIDGQSGGARKDLALRMLRDLIGRNFSRRDPLPMAVFQDALLAVEALILDDQKDAEEILSQVLKTRDLFEAGAASTQAGDLENSPGQLIPTSLVPTLVSLAAKAGTNLPRALLEYNSVAGLDQETLTSVVNSLSGEETVHLWRKAIAIKDSPVSVSLSAAALSRLVSSLPRGSDMLRDWLSGEGWSDSDKEVLRIADKTNPKLFYKLEKHFGKDHTSAAYQRLQHNESKAKLHACKASQRGHQQALDRLRRAKRDLRETAIFLVASITTVIAIQAVISIAREKVVLIDENFGWTLQVFIALLFLILLLGGWRIGSVLRKRTQAERDVDQARKGIFEFCPRDEWPLPEE